jgi:hypothetical protein
VPRPRVRLIHWNAAEAKERAAKLREAGYTPDARPFAPAFLRQLRERRPAAVVIDLSRMPAQGRDVGIALRHAAGTRRIPIVFVDGEPEKVARVKRHLPDAVYTSWGRIRSSLRRAIARPPKQPAVPPSTLAGYAGTPLAKKLGIKADTVVALVGAPPGFEDTLGALPEGVTLRRRARGKRDLTVWFTKSRKDLEQRIHAMAAQVGDGGLWIAWPKKTSGIATDLTQAEVRRIGLSSGLVDYKICAVDATWSSLKFARRKGK